MRTSSFRTAARYAAALAAATLVVATPVMAVDGATPRDPSDLEQRVRELEDTLRDLRKDTRKLEVADEDRSKAKPLAGWKDGFFLQSADGDNKLKIGGYMQLDGRWFVGDDASNGANEFLFRRVRPQLQGTVFKYFDFRIMPDFAGSTLVLQDAYVDARYFPQASLRLGKFKLPVGLERLRSATALTFVERGLPTNLIPNRDIGGELHGDLLRGALSYSLGIFNGVQDGGIQDSDVNDDKDFAGRLFTQPFLDSSVGPLRGLGIGFAGTYGHEKGSATTPDLPSLRSGGQQRVFRYVTDSPATAAGTAFADGDRYRWTPQGYYYWKALGILGEYVSSSQRIAFGGTHAQATNDAWQVETSYVITGEDASFKGVVPAQSFDPFRGTWGALQLAFRYGQLNVDDAVFSLGAADPSKSVSGESEYAVGINWYLNKAVKLVLNYEETSFDGGAKSGDRPSERALLSRIQLVL